MRESISYLLGLGLPMQASAPTYTTLRNAKKTPVLVTIQDSLHRWRGWTIVESSDKYEKVSAQRIEIPVTVKPGEQKVTYRVKYQW